MDLVSFHTSDSPGNVFIITQKVVVFQPLHKSYLTFSLTFPLLDVDSLLVSAHGFWPRNSWQGALDE